jgi:S-disulfanyl-L-cysteine oxidoreductase SoxD
LCKLLMGRIFTIIVFTGRLATVAAAQEHAHPNTVLDGVFTAAQAERGREAYALHCSSCHQNDLQGGAGPALQGLQFIDNWREDSLQSLFTFIQTRMPLRARGTLVEETYLDILTYILSMNSFPAGSKELTHDALGTTQVIGKDGPAPIPNFALISVIGCLIKSGDEWKLEQVSAPLRSRQEKPTTAEIQASAARPVGTGTFRLVYIDSLRPGFVPEQHVGHKLHAHGYLLSNDKGEGVSVTWLEAVASMCRE